MKKDGALGSGAMPFFMEVFPLTPYCPLSQTRAVKKIRKMGCFGDF
jgi:hypothetical protein